jgi:arylsulfatase
VLGATSSPACVPWPADARAWNSGRSQRTVPAAFPASETFDVGADLGSTVSLDSRERRPFRFDGRIHEVGVKLN